MKKSALTSLTLLIAVKFVSACSYAEGEVPVNVFKGKETLFVTMFIGSFVLLLPLVILYFLRKRRGLWAIAVSILSFILFLPVVYMSAFVSICTDGMLTAAAIIAEFFLMSLLFTIQLSSWISQRKTLTKIQ